MYIIGIDVGFGATGLAFYDIDKKKVTKGKSVFAPNLKKKTAAEEFTVYHNSDELISWMTAKKLKVSEQTLFRSMELYKRIYKILYVYRNVTAAYIIEVPHGGSKSNLAARAMGLSTGIISSIVVGFHMSHGIPMYPVTNLDVKRIAGKGSVTKDQVSKAVQREFKINFNGIAKYKIEHIADAAATIIHGLKNIPDIKELLS